MGILRFLLALSVLAVHASSIQFPISTGDSKTFWAMSLINGREAVALFYIISGFYMAMVLNTKYFNSTLRFYINRFLRLWPTYIVILILTCLLTPIVSEIIKATAGSGFIIKAYVWLSNVFILGNDSFWLVSLDEGHLHYLPRFINENSNGCFLSINSPSFTISIEIIFYLMAPFILKSLKRVWIYFGIGVLYHFIFVLSGNNNIIFQYHFFPSSFIYFGLGALAWHYSKNKSFQLTEKAICLIFSACLALMFTYTLLPMIIVIGFTILVPKLFELTKHSKTDKLIGELSYPMYIVHYPVLMYLGGTTISKTYLGITCLVITIVISLLLHFSLEKPIEKWRQKLIPAK